MVDIQSVLAFALAIFSLSVKGIALWRAAKSDQKNWFVALFIAFLLLIPFLNLGGLIDVIYLSKFAKKPLTLDEVRGWIQKPTSKK